MGQAQEMVHWTWETLTVRDCRWRAEVAVRVRTVIQGAQMSCELLPTKHQSVLRRQWCACACSAALLPIALLAQAAVSVPRKKVPDQGIQIPYAMSFDAERLVVL